MGDAVKDVPKDNVGATVQGFVDFDAKKVVAEKQPNGKWKVAPDPDE